jgi:uncharacterized protein (DUF1778 family)
MARKSATSASRQAAARETISLRVPSGTLHLIDQAAAIRGQNRTEFILGVAAEAAQDVILDKRFFVWEPAAYDALLRVLENPPQPNEKLRKLMAEGSSRK